jgi:hypothetical protein
MRIFVGFFGITRSLRYTINDINTNMLAPLRAVADIRLYGHFHLPAQIDNPRSGEHAEPTDATEAELLGLNICVMDQQDPTLIAETLAASKCYPDTWQDGYVSASNLCFQLRSLERLWAMMEPDIDRSIRDEPGSPPLVLFLRPDLRYLDPIPIIDLARAMHAENADLAVPGWHSWGGVNDRFALVTARAAPLYAMRMASLPAALAEYGGLHGESLLAHRIRQAGLHVIPLPVRAVRVRANGRSEARDLREFGLPDEEAVLS